MTSAPTGPEETPPRRSLFREPSFLRFWAGTTASGLATWALPFVLGLAVLDRTIGAAALGVLLATRTAGFLLAVPLGGVLADRYSSRRVVALSGVTAAVATVVLTIGSGTSQPLMAAAAAAVGAGQGACRPAFQALTAEVVDPARRQRANAARTLSVRVTTLVAPGLTALAATAVDTDALLLLTGVLWLMAAWLPPAGRKNTGAPTRDGGMPFVSEFTEGLREARRHPWFLAGLAALATVITTGYSATGVLLPLISRDRYDTEAVLAAALTAYTAGALLGALLVGRWRPRSQGFWALAGLACYGFAPLGLLLPLPAALLVAGYVLAGIGIELFNVPWFTATQREVAPDKLARVSALDFLVSYGLAPLGLALIAPAMTLVGNFWVLVVCAVACFAAPALAALAPGARHFAQPTRVEEAAGRTPTVREVSSARSRPEGTGESHEG
ncbi:Major Facilitator Superfamily protein [Actinopolyspora xinjiangensis]|uniref:Major Facilitator Superfamily protein n=1 Tax=Actinopolyspora xinjiangensis TaxID=405564 RepID=A0A1H0S7R5_9ACTN|nr:MFS transporter [Actinopolyspora xinjiangensis]SDP37812.1 Major Facilitator Superfamily protein [Actinopolyspora xinjiangensis]